MIHNYSWSRLYATAVLETDQNKMTGRILEAELAIRQRSNDAEVDINEINAMQHALTALRTLREERVWLNGPLQKNSSSFLQR